WHFAIVQSSDTDVWVGTGVDFLRSALTGVAEGKHAFLSLPEWKQVTLSAPVWAVRRYQHEGVTNAAAAGLRMSRRRRLDRRAIAITFSCDPAEKQTVIRYL